MVYYIKFLTLIVFLAVTGGICVGMDKKINYKDMSDEELLKAYNADSKNSQIIRAVMARKGLQEKFAANVKDKAVNNINRFVVEFKKSQDKVKELLVKIQKLEEEFEKSGRVFRKEERKLLRKAKRIEAQAEKRGDLSVYLFLRELVKTLENELIEIKLKTAVMDLVDMQKDIDESYVKIKKKKEDDKIRREAVMDEYIKEDDEIKREEIIAEYKKEKRRR